MADFMQSLDIFCKSAQFYFTPERYFQRLEVQFLANPAYT